MAEPTPEQETARDEFTLISDVLVVPTEGKPLPAHRKWTLPLPDRKALADYPAPLDKKQEDTKTAASYVKDSPKQTGRK
jgi:hypothetical protein